MQVKRTVDLVDTLSNDPDEVESNFFCYAATVLSPHGTHFLYRECITQQERR